MPNVTIVVDMVNGFCKHGNLASPRCDAAIPRVRAAIESRKQAGDQLIFLADTHDPNDREFEIFPVHCVRGTSESEVVPELQPLLAGATLMVVVTARGALGRLRPNPFSQEDTP